MASSFVLPNKITRFIFCYQTTYMEVKIPIHPKKNTCIGCGVHVGSIARGRVKKAVSVSAKKALEFWSTQQVVVYPL